MSKGSLVLFLSGTISGSLTQFHDGDSLLPTCRISLLPASLPPRSVACCLAACGVLAGVGAVDEDSGSLQDTVRNCQSYYVRGD